MMNQAMEKLAQSIVNQISDGAWTDTLQGAAFDHRKAFRIVCAALDSAPAEGEPPQPWKCKARSANTGANDPQDCDWPTCGCDPYADKVIAALQESGINFVRAGEQAAPGLRDRIEEWKHKAEVKLVDAKARKFEYSNHFHDGMISAYNIVLTFIAESQRAALTAPVPPRDETFICGECLHGVAQHEWESSAASSCLVEGCKCSGYKKAAPAPVKDARPCDWYNFAPGHELRHNDTKSLGSYDCSCGWHGSNAYIHKAEVPPESGTGLRERVEALIREVEPRFMFDHRIDGYEFCKKLRAAAAPDTPSEGRE